MRDTGTGSKSSYSSLVMAGLSKAYEHVRKTNCVPVDLASARIIIFSDLHRGNRDNSDDFRLCELAYNDALKHYLANGFTLIVLGDAEDLWKYRPMEVKKAYRESLSLESQFSKEERYVRIVGNHDDLWREKGQFKRYFNDLFNLLVPVDGVCLSLEIGNEQVGTIFITHGHQGTLDSDKFSWFSKLVLRYLYRPFQELTGHRTTTPSTSIDLRDEHSKAMYEWSETICKEKAILVAGHTHMPVFLSLNHVEQLMARRAGMINSLAQQGVHAGREQAALDESILRIDGEIEERQRKMGGAPPTIASVLAKRPSYFNTGCCSFSDGDITGIEIEGRKIRLVRWKRKSGSTIRSVPADSDLVDDVFRRL